MALLRSLIELLFRVGKASFMRPALSLCLCFIGVSALAAADASQIFSDPFQQKLAHGWSWVREDPDGWRITKDALEIRVQPGNMWGPENSGKNVLLRDLPPVKEKPLAISVTVQNRPSEQYEQVDLVWYCDDAHMVKIGQELVDGQLSIVMGREEGDRTRTIAIIPLTTHKAHLRFVLAAEKIEGFFRPDGQEEWRKAGECDLPRKTGCQPKMALQCYQGPANVEHWARIQNFNIQEFTSAPKPQ